MKYLKILSFFNFQFSDQINQEPDVRSLMVAVEDWGGNTVPLDAIIDWIDTPLSSNEDTIDLAELTDILNGDIECREEIVPPVNVDELNHILEFITEE